MTQIQGAISKPSAVCPKCATKYKPDQVFCEQCGSRLALKDAETPRAASDPVDLILFATGAVSVDSAEAFPEMAVGAAGKLVIFADRVVFQPCDGPDCVFPMWEITGSEEYHTSVGIFNRVTTWYLTLVSSIGRCSFKFLVTGNEKQDARNAAALIQSCRTAAAKLKKQVEGFNKP